MTTAGSVARPEGRVVLGSLLLEPPSAPAPSSDTTAIAERTAAAGSSPQASSVVYATVSLSGPQQGVSCSWLQPAASGTGRRFEPSASITCALAAAPSASLL